MCYLLGELSLAMVFGAMIFAMCTQAQLQPHTRAHTLNWKKDIFIFQHWEHGQWWKMQNGPFLCDNLSWNLICLGHREIHATGSHVELARLGIDSLFYFRQNGFQFVYMLSLIHI